jgi:hypothetical protein
MWTLLLTLATLAGPRAAGTPPALPGHPWYDASSVTTEPDRDGVTIEVVRTTVSAELPAEVTGLARRTPRGRLEPVEVADLDDAELFGIRNHILWRAVGAEADLVVIDLEGRRVPVSVWWEADGVLSVRRGPALSVSWEDAPSSKELSRRYGIPPLVDDGRPWDPRARTLLDRALARLSDRERALVVDVAFHRVPSAPQDQRGAYTVDERGPRIEVYDALFEDPTHFAGTPEDAHPTGVRVLLHELAHAIADAPARRTFRELDAAEAALRQSTARYNALQEAAGADATEEQRAAIADADEAVRTDYARYQLLTFDADKAVMQRLRGQSPAVAGLTRVLGQTPAPTAYGRTNATEAFAECFSLFRIDPAALRRTAPAALAWFEADGHLPTAGSEP